MKTIIHSVLSVLIGSITAVVLPGCAPSPRPAQTATQRPETQPAATRPVTTQRSGAPRGGRGNVASSPRDKLPFTNGNLNNINAGLPTLFITGDSTAATGDPDHRGWGAVLIDYFDAGKINLVNQAQGGASFPSYYATRWAPVVARIKPGDYVIIEFGHNGGQLNGTGPETRQSQLRTGSGPAGVVHTFGWYVRKFIGDVRSKGGIPIISSTTTRNLWTNPNATFSDNGKLITKKDHYNPAEDRVERGMGNLLPGGERTMLVWARQIAAEQKVAFVDHSDITADRYEKMGREAMQKYHPVDHTHTSTEGAMVNAETFIAGLKAVPNMPLVKYLNDKGKAIAPYAAPAAAK